MEALQSAKKYDILQIKDGFIQCPICRSKCGTKILPTTAATSLPVFCRKCKTELLVDVYRGQSVKRQHP